MLSFPSLSVLSAAATGLLAVASAGPIRDRSVCLHTDITRNCWTDGFDVLTNTDEKWPNTGKTVNYNFDITNTTLAPDGVPRQMFVVNGQYPGPTIFADWGDKICVNVKNSLQNNATGIHWHGFRQFNTNTQDGAAGVTECPIAPGQSKQYCFLASQYGTTWYHSHMPSQYAEGISGPIIIRGPTPFNYDVDLGALTLTDWFHQPFFQVQSLASHAAGPPTADTILINGSMTSATGGKHTQLRFQPGKKHLLRLINTGINNYFHVSLDNHEMIVAAADFVPILPYKTTSLVLAVGQRYDVVIDATQAAGAFWLRVGPGGDGSPTSCDGPVTNRDARAIVTYEGTPADATPTTTGTLPLGCKDEVTAPIQSTTVPQGPLSPSLNLNFNPSNGTQPVFWTINGSALHLDWTTPSLTTINGGGAFPAPANAEQVPAGNGWSYWVIQQDPAILAKLPHPIHLHGHDFFVLAQGVGDYHSATLNYKNPPRRDTATLDANGYLIIAFKTDNPGAWLLHCHIPFHAEGGLAVQFIERQEEIKSKMDLASLDGNCGTFKSWFANNPNLDGGSGI